MFARVSTSLSFVLVLVLVLVLDFSSPRSASAQAAPAPSPNDPLLPPPEPQPAVTKSASPGYFGATCDNAPGDGQGVVVLAVNAGGPADTAGLKPGDRIVRVNQTAIANLDDFAQAIGPQPPGQKLSVEVSRSGRREVLAVTLGERPADPATGAARAAIAPRSVVALEPRAVLGVHATDLTDANRARYGLSVRRGAVIETITPGSPADRAGLPLGGAVVAVDGQKVDTADDLRAVIGAANAGDDVELSYYRGEELQRKRVRLVAAPRRSEVVEVAPQPQNPGGPRISLRPGEDRPVLRALERALQNSGVAGGIPGSAPGAPSDAVPPVPERPVFDPAAELDDLRIQVRDLRAQNADLERRVKELEKKLAKP